MGIKMTLTSLIWFTVRVILEAPSEMPLFSGSTFAFGDTLALVLGILGIGSLIIESLGDQ
jgi:hypothetical protein